MKKWIWAVVILLAGVAVVLGIRGATVREDVPPRAEMAIIHDLVASQGNPAPGKSKAALLEELSAVNAASAARWEKIMDCWEASGSDMTLYPNALPDGLEDTGKLCIIVLGYQLNPDGSMKEELIGRLETAKKSAEKYPDAYILCTGGGTAAASTVTEAQAMAAWLVENGIDADRVLTESRSLTTTENALYCGELLKAQHPEITQAALVSSDYHIPWAGILFQTQFILADQSIALVSNAVYPTATTLRGASLLRYQTNGILEIASYH